MRTNFTLMAIFGLLFFGETPKSFAQADTIYVHIAATGTNDGTSWEDAFPNLQDALALAGEGDEIWVAQGTYYPDTMGGSDASTFLVDKNIKLLGGFNGEGGTSANDQNPDQYISRLSGDLNQDDVLDSVEVNRADNVMTVLTIGGEVDGDALIDGFYIQNGHADGDLSAFQNERGGGCFSFGSPVISRCVFDNNFADERGGGLYFHTSGAEGAQVMDCYFRENVSEEGGAAMCFVQAGEGVTFTACDFDGNRAEDDGGALRIYNSNCVIDDCQFQFNRAGRGGAVDVQSIWDDNETQILNSFFLENQARNGGAVNFQTGSGLGAHDNFITIDGCEFFGNQAIANNGGRQGGALRVNIERTSNGCAARVRNCDFTQNMSEQDAGAIAANLRGETMTFLLENSMVNLNFGRNGGGVLVSSNDIASGMVTIRGVDFMDNSAENDGGALSLLARESSRLDHVIEGCNFIFNGCLEEGGAVSIETRDTAKMDIRIEASLFQENSGEQNGGAISIHADGNNLLADIKRCAFQSNNSLGFGAALGTLPSTTEEGVITFENCFASGNLAADAAFSIDSFPQTNFVNCTVTENIADIGLAVFNDASVYLQNNIFFNNGQFNFGVDNSVNTGTSGGGNLIGDSSMDFFLGGLDQSGLDPLFDISPEGDYLLMESSPAVDMGVLPDDVPDFDLIGNERVVNCIDAGAYESPYMVSSACLTDVDEVTSNFGLAISPNPADEFLQIKWEQNFPEIQLDLLDVNGRILRSENLENRSRHDLDVSKLKSGVYLLRVTVEDISEVRRVVVH